MAITTSGTTLTFNDATTQTTAPVNTNANVASVTITGGTAISITSATTTGAAAATINNTGVTSIVAGTGISISGATGAVTVTNSSPGAVTSVNSQTGAVDTTTLDSIGSVIWAANITTSTVAGGSTIAGSNLRYASTISASGSSTTINGYYSEGSGSNPSTAWVGIVATRTATGNTGYTNPGGTTALSGTWRAMGGCSARSTFYSSCDNATNSQNGVALFVRVS